MDLMVDIARAAIGGDQSLGNKKSLVAADACHRSPESRDPGQAQAQQAVGDTIVHLLFSRLRRGRISASR